jgi:hypothetical protein
MTKENKIEKLEKEADMKGIIIIENYLFEGNKIYGIKDDDGWVLDDGDIYSIKDLIDEGYKVSAITPLQIEEKGKQQAIKNVLEITDNFFEEWSNEIDFPKTMKENFKNKLKANFKEKK